MQIPGWFLPRWWHLSDRPCRFQYHDIAIHFLKIEKCQGCLHLKPEIDRCIVAAFSVHDEGAVIQIHIIEIQPHAFGYTDAGSEQER